MESKMQNQIEGGISEYERMAAEIDELHDLLRRIGDRAHEASTGPAVPDVLW